IRSAFSNTTTAWPARASCWAAARPAGPEPTTATLRPVLRGLGWRDPALVPRLVDDRVLDRLDADRVLVDAQRAGFLARRRADAPGELGEVVRRVQRLDRVLPVLPVDEVVEVRNDVVDRAAGHAERHAAVHAARALDLGLLVAEVRDELAVVLRPRAGRLRGLLQARVLEKAGQLAHRPTLRRRPCGPRPHSRRARAGTPSGTPSRTSHGASPSRRGSPVRACCRCSAPGSRSAA